MKRPTLANLANFAQFISISAAMSSVLLGFLLPLSYLLDRSAVWLLPKMASSQYASLFGVAFMIVMLLMAVPAIISFVFAAMQRKVALHNRSFWIITMIVAGSVCTYFSSLSRFPLLGFFIATAAVAFLASGIDIFLGFWGMETRASTRGADNSAVRVEAMRGCGKWYNCTWARGVGNWCARFLGAFLALVILWNAAAAALPTQPTSRDENFWIAIFLIMTAVLLTTLGNGLAAWVETRHEGSYRALGAVAFSIFVVVFGIGRLLPVALFTMRLSGMGGIYESIHLKPGVHEGQALPGFGAKPRHGPLKACLVTQARNAFYIGRWGKGGLGACSEQIHGPQFYRVWRLARADVAWVRERKPPTTTQSQGTAKSNASRGGPQQAPA